jgi:hypothetical protein
METHIKSGMAVQECIRALCQAPSNILNAEAILIPDDPSRGRGAVLFAFERPNPSDFPIVTCDVGIMMSFGIPHGSFNPHFDIFSFRRGGMELRIVSGNHAFTLSGIRLV